MSERSLKVGLPKGSLEKSTFELLKRAGYAVRSSSRSYYPSIDDPELKGRLLRPQDMSRYIERGVIDIGLTGQDWVAENESDVEVITKLTYAKQTLNPVRWVLAVPEDSDIGGVEDLQGKRISTELVHVTEKWLASKGVTAEVEFSHGATETKAPDLVDAIVELTETGSSLRANRLKIIDTLMESVTVLIANHDAMRDAWKREKTENLAMLLEGAISAQEMVGLKLNAHEKDLDAIQSLLPAMRTPTLSRLSDKSWFALEVIVSERTVRDLIPQLKRQGAEGIIEYPLNKVIP